MLLIYAPMFLAVAVGLVWWTVHWAKRHSRSPWRWGGVVALVMLAYAAVFVHAFVKNKYHDPRTIIMLDLVQAELGRQGAKEPQKLVSLGWVSRYAGCRAWLLEHLVVDNCFSLRTGVETGIAPETLRQVVQDACRSEACPYKGTIALTIVYMSPPRTYSTEDGGVVTERDKAGIYHFRLHGRN